MVHLAIQRDGEIENEIWGQRYLTQLIWGHCSTMGNCKAHLGWQLQECTSIAHSLIWMCMCVCVYVCIYIYAYARRMWVTECKTSGMAHLFVGLGNRYAFFWSPYVSWSRCECFIWWSCALKCMWLTYNTSAIASRSTRSLFLDRNKTNSSASFQTEKQDVSFKKKKCKWKTKQLILVPVVLPASPFPSWPVACFHSHYIGGKISMWHMCDRTN